MVHAQTSVNFFPVLASTRRNVSFLRYFWKLIYYYEMPSAIAVKIT